MLLVLRLGSFSPTDLLSFIIYIFIPVNPKYFLTDLFPITQINMNMLLPFYPIFCPTMKWFCEIFWPKMTFVFQGLVPSNLHHSSDLAPRTSPYGFCSSDPLTLQNIFFGINSSKSKAWRARLESQAYDDDCGVLIWLYYEIIHYFLLYIKMG